MRPWLLFVCESEPENVFIHMNLKAHHDVQLTKLVHVLYAQL